MITAAATAFQKHCAREHGGDALHLPDWTADDWSALFARASSVRLASSEVLIRAGQDERALYFVVSGLLEVTSSGRDALGRLFRELPGSVLGEISFFDGQPRSATVWASQPTELLRLDFEGWRAFAAEHPARGNDLLFALGRVLAFRTRRGEARRATTLG